MKNVPKNGHSLRQLYDEPNSITSKSNANNHSNPSYLRGDKPNTQ